MAKTIARDLVFSEHRNGRLVLHCLWAERTPDDGVTLVQSDQTPIDALAHAPVILTLDKDELKALLAYLAGVGY